MIQSSSPVILLLNCMLPLELTFTPVNVLSYSWYGNGNVTWVVQSSQWFPMSNVPGTIGACRGGNDVIGNASRGRR